MYIWGLVKLVSSLVPSKLLDLPLISQFIKYFLRINQGIHAWESLTNHSYVLLIVLHSDVKQSLA